MQLSNLTLLILTILLPQPLAAEGFELLSGQDVSIETGGMVGTVASPDVKKGVPVEFGGAVAGVIFNKDFSNSFTGFIEPQIAIDGTTQSVLKKALNFGLVWHLVGGARRLDSKVSGARFEEENSKNLSLLVRSGYVSFSARPTTLGAKPLQGAVVENCAGFEYRHDVFAESALGLRLLKSIITFPTSVENLTTDYLEVALFWRKVL